MNKKRRFLFGLIAVIILGAFLLALPPVWSRVAFHAQQIYAEIKYKLNPPEQIVFTPAQTGLGVTSTATVAATNTPQAATPEPSATPTLTPTPLPASAFLKGVKAEPQAWNNCGPATLSMYLSYWRWAGTQLDIAPVVKPNDRDKNVMPYELQNYVLNNTEYQAIVRVGGDVQTLKTLINAGFPVMIEKGFDVSGEGWMGHYELVIGYDDEKSEFKTQDSYFLISKPGTTSFTIGYDELYRNWRAFNYVFLLVYPPEKENDVLDLLGPLADEKTAIQIASERARADATALTDVRDQFFAWFDLGSSLVNQQSYSDAASAYDQAYTIYPSIPDADRPWRMIWYQTGPYFAYHYSGRYQDVINLATTTLNAMSEPILEESYYWRAMAEIETGDQTSAVADLRESLNVHENFEPSLALLQQIGVNP